MEQSSDALYSKWVFQMTVFVFGGRIMSISKSIVVFSLLAAGCSTTQSMQESDSVAVENPPIMRHSLREMVRYDSYNMSRLVDKEINMKEKDEDAFLKDATMVLTQTVLVQPHYVEREVALRELKGKLDQEDYIVILGQAADNLIFLARSANASDQAGAIVGLNNLVMESNMLHRPELRPTLQKIAEANIQVSTEAKKYAEEPMERLMSPSTSAQLVLGIANK
jgi:hypothetical protein